MSTVVKQPWTAEELVRLPPDWRYEIDEGELVIMAPTGAEHARLENRVAFVLSRFVYEHRLGEVLTGEAGFRLGREPETLRAADVAFLSQERWARIHDRTGFSDIAPDLVVEIHDPSDRDLPRKIQQYLAAGVRAVWIIDPTRRTLSRHASTAAPVTLSEPDATVHEPVLPGFSCRLRELFAGD